MIIMEILLKEEDNKGVAYVGDYNKPDAAMTYSIVGEDLLIIDHTEVSDIFRGQGVGRKLLNEIVSKARSENKKILPLCPYAKSVFNKVTSISDVLKK